MSEFAPSSGSSGRSNNTGSIEIDEDSSKRDTSRGSSVSKYKLQSDKKGPEGSIIENRITPNDFCSVLPRQRGERKEIIPEQINEKKRRTEFTLKRPARPHDYNPTTGGPKVRELTNYPIAIVYQDIDGNVLPFDQGQGVTLSATKLYIGWQEEEGVDVEKMSQRGPSGTTFAFQSSLAKAPKIENIESKKRVPCPHCGHVVSETKLLQHVQTEHVAETGGIQHSPYSKFKTEDIIVLCKHILEKHKWKGR